MNKRHLGEESLREFIKTLYRLLIIEKKRFDLIAGAGDSGQVMVKITKIAFDIFGIPFPANIIFPIYRYKNYPKKILFDNSTIIKDYSKSQIPKNTKNILFVDDEIENGNAAGTTLKTIIAITNKDDFSFTIIAEDGGFKFNRFKEKYRKIDYTPPRKRPDGVYNAISFAIPQKYLVPIKKALGKEENSRSYMKSMCILLDLPIKELNNKNPEFNFRIKEIVKKSIPNLDELQKDYKNHLTNKINKIILDLTKDKLGKPV